MSGAPIGEGVAGIELEGCGPAGPPFTAKTKIETTTTPPKIAHGNLDEPPERGVVSSEAPQPWQKTAVGDSAASHLGHARSRVGAPQEWQNFPVLVAPHFGQVRGVRFWLMGFSNSSSWCESGTCNIDWRTRVCV